MKDRFLIWGGGWGIGAGVEQLVPGPETRMAWLYFGLGIVFTIGAIWGAIRSRGAGQGALK